MRRLVIWQGTDEWRTEVAEVELGPDGLRATGTQIGADPFPYRLDYRLETSDRFVTRILEIDLVGDDLRRSLRLESGDGVLSGGDGLPIPALDCDLGLSPLTNAMPILRHRLHEVPGEMDFVMAWVSVPDLAVHESAQRYEHVRPGVVRFVDRGLHEGFTAELRLDADGLVAEYPGLARRVS